MKCNLCENGKMYSSRDLHKSGGDYLGVCFRCNGTGLVRQSSTFINHDKQNDKKIHDLVESFFEGKDCSYP